MKLSIDEGRYLVRLARQAVKEYLVSGKQINPPPDTPPRLKEKKGVFVTIEKIEIDPSGVWRRTLRGCIGIPEPIYPLVEATIYSAISAATRDPRFPPMSYSELKDVVFEVSVLTKPQLIKITDPKDYPKEIKVGYDGLIVERGLYKGLLLPQVAVEYGWDERKFLEQACLKAGLPPDSWLLPDTKIYKFQAQIFYELKPEGDVIERLIHLGRSNE